MTLLEIQKNHETLNRARILGSLEETISLDLYKLLFKRFLKLGYIRFPYLTIKANKLAMVNSSRYTRTTLYTDCVEEYMKANRNVLNLIAKSDVSISIVKDFVKSAMITLAVGEESEVVSDLIIQL